MPGEEGTPEGTVFPPPPPAPLSEPKQAASAGAVDPVRRGHTWGMACHLAALAGFVGFPFGYWLGPLIVWLATRDRYAFADDQGKESLNFQLSILLYGLLCIPMICVFCIGLVLLGALHLFNLVMIVIAAARASGGEAYRYPLTIRFLK